MFLAESVCLCVCLFVCQHSNFEMSKHRMMKIGGRCVVQKSGPSLNLGIIAPTLGVCTPKNVSSYDIGKIGAGCLVFFHIYTYLSLILCLFVNSKPAMRSRYFMSAKMCLSRLTMMHLRTVLCWNVVLKRR